MFSPSNLLLAYSESTASLIPSADKWIKCFKLYSLQSLANKDGKIEWMFLNVFPFFCSNNIPIKLMQISVFLKRALIFFSSNILASTISIYPAFAWVW